MKANSKYIVEEQVCGTCAHYYQHYVLTADGRFQALWYGHCSRPKLRRSLPDEVCPRWQGAEREETVNLNGSLGAR